MAVRRRRITNEFEANDLPHGEIDMWAVVYGAPEVPGIQMRAFLGEQQAWAYGRIMQIKPVRIRVKQLTEQTFDEMTVMFTPAKPPRIREAA